MQATGEMTAIQTEIEERLAQAEPAVEVLLAEVVGGTTVRVFIDHPDGVTLALCERVTHHLASVRERYALEVSSPGSDRPLSKPEHFRRYQGRRVRVRLAQKRDRPPRAQPGPLPPLPGPRGPGAARAEARRPPHLHR